LATIYWPWKDTVDLVSVVVTLFLIMDPLGNIPVFLSVLKEVPPERRRVVLVREILFAYVVLLIFLFFGNYLLRLLHLQQEAVSISGGIVLFLIALRMIFPPEGGMLGETPEGEPFLVPLAIPLIAGPSILAALLLLQRRDAGNVGELLAATTIAWALTGIILLASPFFYRILRQRGLIAMERLMGMLLVMIALQMLMNGLSVVMKR
jgi:multiple antibiotic resistance protein